MPKQSVVENAYVQCPYYKHERHCVICCEGAEENSSIHMTFGANTRRKEYEKQFCQKDWSRCIIAEVHNRRWDYVV